MNEVEIKLEKSEYLAGEEVKGTITISLTGPEIYCYEKIGPTLPELYYQHSGTFVELVAQCRRFNSCN